MFPKNTIYGTNIPNIIGNRKEKVLDVSQLHFMRLSITIDYASFQEVSQPFRPLDYSGQLFVL